MEIILWRVPIGSSMDHVFDEVVEGYTYAFQELGHEVSVVKDRPPSPPAGGRIFVIGANVLPPGSTLPEGAILLNFEQFPAWRAHLPELFSGHVIWSYDPIVNQRFVRAGLDSRLVRFGWTPTMNERRTLVRTETNDVFFVGWLNEERRRRLDLLRSMGLRVFASDNVWGLDRDLLMAQSRLVLSLRSYVESPFMAVRVFPVWAQRIAVASDDFPGREEHFAGIEQAMLLLPFEEKAMVASIAKLCASPSRLAELREAGHAYARAHPLLPQVERALAEISP